MLELDGLTRRYGDVVALDGLSFDVEPGRIFGFVEPNGAGKTTAMRIVLGVLAPDAGEVRWRGKPIDASVRARFGYMPEQRGLYPKMRVGDQLAYLAMLHGVGDDQARMAAEEWMTRVGIADRAVAMGIVEEKASRIVEVLLATISPRDLLMGKLLGIGIVGLGQLLLIGVVGTALGVATGAVQATSDLLTALPVVLIWFLLGYAFYACLFAVAGALVPRQEEVQNATGPLLLMLSARSFSPSAPWRIRAEGSPRPCPSCRRRRR